MDKTGPEANTNLLPGGLWEFHYQLLFDHQQARIQDFERGPQPNFWRPTPNWQIGGALTFHWYFLNNTYLTSRVH